MLIEINLLPKKEKRSFFLLISSITVLVLGLLAGIWLTIYLLSMQDKIEYTNQEITMAQLLKTTLEQQLNQGSDYAAVQMYQDLVQQLEQQELPVTSFLKQLVSLLPQGAKYQSYVFNPDGTIHLSVNFSSMDEISNYLYQLSAYPLTQEVKLNSVNKTQTEGEASAYSAIFQLKIEYDRGGN